MTVDAELAYLLSTLEQRVSRLETLEQSTGGVGGGDLALIETKELTVTGIMQFTSIPATYTHLFYTGFLKGANGTQIYVVINASGASSLSGIALAACATSAGATNVSAGVTNTYVLSAAGVGVPSNVFGAMWGWIPVYLTSIHTGTLALGGAFNRDDAIVHQLTQGRGGGNFGDATAISQLDFIHSGGNNFVAGSKISLYGLVTA